MKKKLISLAVASALLTPILAHADGPQVYGRVHLSYGSVDNTADKSTATPSTTDNIQLRSHASRFGVKGSRDFGNGLSGIYKLEWQVNPDSDGADDDGIERRNQYVGLKGDWGQFRFGRHDTPMKMANGEFDLFSDTDADVKKAGDQDGQNRVDNVVAYLGKSGNLKYAIALVPGEGDGVTAGDSAADTISASLTYESGPLFVALAQDSHDDTAGQAENSMTSLTGIYKMGNMQVGVLWQSGVEGAAATGEDEDWLGVHFSSKFAGSNKFKLQYIMVEDNATTAREGTLMAVGVDHKFDKKTTGYVMYSSLEEDLGGVSDVENNFLGAGLKLKF